MKIRSWANVVNNDVLWLVDANQNGLYRLNLVKMNTEFVTLFDQIPMQGMDMHNEIYVYENKLIITPCNLNCFLSYDIESGEIEYFWINEEIKNPFTRSVMIANKIYLLSNDGQILCFDCNMRTVSTVGQFNDMVKSCIKPGEFSVTSSDNTLLVRSAKSKDAYIFYPETGIANKIVIGDAIDDICMTYLHKGKIWITYYNKQSISVWDILECRLEEYRCDTDKWAVDKPFRAYSRVIFDERVFLANYNVMTPMVVDEGEKIIKEIPLESSVVVSESNKWSPLYSDAHRWNNKMIFTPQIGEEFLVYDIDTKKVNKVQAFIDYDKGLFMSKSYKHGELMLEEKESEDLSFYIKSLTYMDEV